MEIELLVDTGAIMSVIPRQILETLGIKPIGRRTFRVFGGKTIERDVGIAIIKYADAFAGVQVAFGEEGDTPVLGTSS